jgi:sodium transport system permease protein
VAGAAFCGIVILLAYFFMNVAMPQWKDFGGFVRSTLVLQITAIATPALLMAIVLTASPRKTLLLRWPAWPTLLAALLLALAAHPVSQAIQEFVLYLFPVNPAMAKALTGVTTVLTEPPLWEVLLVFATLPAVCEELAFRGFILSGFRRPGHKWRAVVLSAFFFAVTHGMIVQQEMVAFLFGIVLGLLAVQSGSILPAVIFHVTHNGLLAASARASGQIVKDWPPLGWFAREGSGGALEFTWLAIAIGAAVMLAILLWFLRLPDRAAPEEQRRQKRIAEGLQWNG